MRPGQLVPVLSPRRRSGRLRALDRLTVVLDREDARVGQVSVHFPRVGYRVLRD